MSRPLRLVLVVGCALVGALHLPDATRALEEGIASRASEVRAMERSPETAALDRERSESELVLEDRVARGR